ncbi:hypothetical protein FQN60_010692 [Etheostoma spectabile]|uniref:Uncharacterized protein n=1 Tax=Etheostoma spectabile TaxID=54343 RepID=A0A5J5CC55_9PERO|nr:hypothetical protein FQN60_010692 [Etheostoma spectabile]
MEVSMRSDMACPTGIEGYWGASFKRAYPSAASDWQVMFQTAQPGELPISLHTRR